MKKPPQKVAYLWQLGVFFSAAPTAQNSPELHFRFINYFIQPSLLESLYDSQLLNFKSQKFHIKFLLDLSIPYFKSFVCVLLMVCDQSTLIKIYKVIRAHNQTDSRDQDSLQMRPQGTISCLTFPVGFFT